MEADSAQSSSVVPDHVALEISRSAFDDVNDSTNTSLNGETTSAVDDAANVMLLAAAANGSTQSRLPSINKVASKPTTPKTPAMVKVNRFSMSHSLTPSGYTNPFVYDEEDDGKPQSRFITHSRWGFWKVIFLVELVLSLVFLGLFVTSLTKRFTLWRLDAWKWSLLLLLIFGGRLAWELIVSSVYLLVRGACFMFSKSKNEDTTNWMFTPKEKFGYVLVGLKPSFQIFFWAATVLISWCLIVYRGVDRSSDAKHVLHQITRALVGCLIGAGLWWLKTLLMKLVAYNFIVERSLQSIQNSIDDQETFKALWEKSRPLDGYAEKLNKEGRKETITDDFNVKDRVRTWTPPDLVDIITTTQLPVIVDCRSQDNTPERAARITANELFARLAGSYDTKYVDTAKVLRLLEDEQQKRIPVMEEEGGAGQISRSHFRKWMIKVHLDRLLLLRTLNGRDRAVRELNTLCSVVATVIILIIWLLVMGYLTTQLMILIATQILAWNFLFTNTAQTTFEAIIFVFVTRPFDVGDLCYIGDDKEQVVVHQMKFLITIFKKSNGENLIYPNDALMAKCITNFKGIPETADSVEMTIDSKTSSATIKELKSRLEEYLRSKPKQWRSDTFYVVVDDVDGGNKKVGIYTDHVVNFYNGGDRKKRRMELIDEVKNVIAELKIVCLIDPL